MSGLELVVWGLFAASIGRLIAQDTVLLQQRNRVLDRVCRLYDAPYAWHDRMEQDGGRSLRAVETSGNVGACWLRPQVRPLDLRGRRLKRE